MEKDRRSFQNTILDMMLGRQQGEKLHTNVSMKNEVESLCNENEKYSQKSEGGVGDDIVNMERTAYKSPGGYSGSNYVSKHNQRKQISSITVKEKDPKFVSSKKAKLVRDEASIRMSINFLSVGLYNVGPFKLCNSIRDLIEAAVVDYIFDRDLKSD
ncbi:hypothetical protein PanWU01x14_165150 [Parasponia andersonii]|uniref:Uncharacterized protein n=1 Tax=Parasponia andersonii TaxID=3476 RepID=A0A2P5CCA1_PARAD|nr:hypothetical protein PanWU01x14_165150 [Parasponia andersonii]